MQIIFTIIQTLGQALPMFVLVGGAVFLIYATVFVGTYDDRVIYIERPRSVDLVRESRFMRLD